MPNAPLSSSFQEWVTKVGGSKSGGVLLKNPILAAVVVTIIAVAIFAYMKGMSVGAKLLLAVVLNTIYLYLFYAAVRSYATETAEKRETTGLFAPDDGPHIGGGHIDFTDDDTPIVDDDNDEGPPQVMGGGSKGSNDDRKDGFAKEVSKGLTVKHTSRTGSSK